MHPLLQLPVMKTQIYMLFGADRSLDDTLLIWLNALFALLGSIFCFRASHKGLVTWRFIFFGMGILGGIYFGFYVFLGLYPNVVLGWMKIVRGFALVSWFVAYMGTAHKSVTTQKKGLAKIDTLEAKAMYE